MKFLLFLLTLICTPAFAQKRVITDSAPIVVRSFNESELADIREKNDFRYFQSQHYAPGLWERFWSWTWQKIADLMAQKTRRQVIYSLLLIAAAGVIVFFAAKITGMSRSSLWNRDSKSALPFTSVAENINNIEFDEAIRDAIETKNFRLAIRLMYLQVLKLLSDTEQIQWQPNKTNADYIKEVEEKPWKTLFLRLTYHFEYSWYGERSVGKEELEQLQSQFQYFNKQLH